MKPRVRLDPSKGAYWGESKRKRTRGGAIETQTGVRRNWLCVVSLVCHLQTTRPRNSLFCMCRARTMSRDTCLSQTPSYDTKNVESIESVFLSGHLMNECVYRTRINHTDLSEFSNNAVPNYLC